MMSSVNLEKFNDVMESVNAKFQRIESNLSTYKNDILKLLNVVKSEITSEMKVLIDNIKDMNNRIDLLDERVDFLERERISCDIVISGIPRITSKSPLQIFMDICDVLQFNSINVNNVNECRVTSNCKPTQLQNKGSRSKNQTLFVRMHYRHMKSEFFKKYKDFGDLKLKNIGHQLDTRIYCNDGMTKRNLIIFNRAKQFQLNSKIYKAFTKSGLVYVIAQRNGNPVLINNIKKLQLVSKDSNIIDINNTNIPYDDPVIVNVIEPLSHTGKEIVTTSVSPVLAIKVNQSSKVKRTNTVASSVESPQLAIDKIASGQSAGARTLRSNNTNSTSN